MKNLQGVNLMHPNQEVNGISAIITNLVLNGIDDILEHLHSPMNLTKQDPFNNNSASIQVAILTALKLKTRDQMHCRYMKL